MIKKRKMSFANQTFPLAILATVGFLLFCFKPLSDTLASINYYAARPIIEKWHADPTSITLKEYQTAYDNAVSAVEYQPELALYTDTLSEVIQWGVFAGLVESPTAAYIEASKLTETSILNRPVWAVSWANLAVLKWELGEIDGQFLTYLNKAAELGNNSPEVHIVWAKLGLQLIDVNLPLFFEVQDTVQQRIIKGLTHPRARDSVINTIEQRKKQLIVCTWLSKNANKDNTTVSLGSTDTSLRPEGRNLRRHIKVPVSIVERLGCSF